MGKMEEILRDLNPLWQVHFMEEIGPINVSIAGDWDTLLEIAPLQKTTNRGREIGNLPLRTDQPNQGGLKGKL